MKFCIYDSISKEIMHERFKDFIVFGLIAMLICVIFYRGTEYAVISGKDYEEVNLTDCLTNVKGYKTDDFKSFKVMEDDPYLLFDFSKLQKNNMKVKCVMFELGQEIQMPMVHIYYGRDIEEFSEQDSEGLVGDYSKEIEICSLKSMDGFMYLRLDVDQNFDIENVMVAYDYQLKWGNNIGRLILLLVLGIGITVLCVFNNAFYVLYSSCLKKIKKYIDLISKNIISILKISFLIVIIFCTVIFFEYCINSDNNYLNPYVALIITSITSIVMVSIFFKDQILHYMHIYYFIICMVIGTITIITLPATVAISVDDETHYLRTENLSWGAKDQVSAAASNCSRVYAEFIQNGNMYEHTARHEWEDYLNRIDEQFPIIGSIPEEVPLAKGLEITSFAYIPGATGLIIGRAIGLSYSSTFRLGKWMNLLCYTTLFSWAVKLIKDRGKILIAVIGMLPTSVFMACAYSCDWWIISFVVLGYALFIREIRGDKPLSMKQEVRIMAIMAIGILPKAIYFPLILPMLFVRKEKLQDSTKQRILMISTMVLLVSTFMLPMLIGGVGTGDPRGGSGVNSIEQIKFIIGNPVQYVRILLRFLKSYLSPDNAYGYLTNFLYYGQAQYFTVCLMVMTIVAAVDNAAGGKGIEYNMPKYKAIMAGTCFITIALVATELYIGFTAAGEDTIAGCQPGYILPVLFPFLFFNFGLRVKLDDTVKRNLFLVSINVMMFIYLYGIYLLHVKYF